MEFYSIRMDRDGVFVRTEVKECTEQEALEAAGRMFSRFGQAAKITVETMHPATKEWHPVAVIDPVSL